MYEVSSVGGSKFDAAAAIQQHKAAVHRQNSVKDQMRRFLRGSKSLVRSTSDARHHKHSHPVENGKVHRNGVVVAIVDGLPFVVGGKNKKHVGIIVTI